MNTRPVFYPQVTSVPVQVERVRQKGDPQSVPGEFDRLLGDQLNVREPLKFSAHASQRIQDRKIDLDPEKMVRVNEALDRAAAKGIEDTLILTNDAAFIVNVKNRTVVTALDRNSLIGNVFTNIDGAVII